MEELEKDLEIAVGLERLAFFREMLPLVTPQNVPWKAADWNNPVEWKPRASLPWAKPVLSLVEGPKEPALSEVEGV